MRDVLLTASRSLMSMLANMLLFSIAGIIAVSALALTALYLADYLEETPAVKSLQCLIGVSRPDCPRYAEEMANLKANLEAMIREHKKLNTQLTGLRAVETAVDEITLFESHTDPSSGLIITVGTVYTEFVKPRPAPEAYFCYIDLPDGSAGENRSLHIQSHKGEIDLSDATLQQANVSEVTLRYARSVCKAFNIGEAR